MTGASYQIKIQIKKDYTFALIDFDKCSIKLFWIKILFYEQQR